MAQQLKPETRETICEGALRVFAERDYRSATMAEIAKVAGVSTGNIYLYFENKERLFRAVVSDDFVAALTKRMFRKIRALEGVRDLDELSPESPYHVFSQDLLDLWIAERQRVVILLARASGSPYEDFAERAVERLVRLAIAYLGTIRPDAQVNDATRFVLHEIYRNLVSAMAGVLARFEGEEKIREATQLLSAYHLSGLKRIFDTIAAGSAARKRAG